MAPYTMTMVVPSDKVEGDALVPPAERTGARRAQGPYLALGILLLSGYIPVSYTHLTLPTILLV